MSDGAGWLKWLVASLSRVVRTVASFEGLYVLALFSGTFRPAPLLRSLPVNLTAVLMAVGTLAGGYALWRRGWHLPRRGMVQMAWLSGFFAWLLLSMAWSPAPSYAREKALEVVGLCGWFAAGAALIIAHDPKRIQRYLVLIAALAVWVAAVAAPAPSARLIAPLGANYLNVGRLVGLGLLILYGSFLFGRWTLWRRLALAVPMALLGYVLVSLRGRGPLLATALAALCPLACGLRVLANGHVRVRVYAIGLVGLLGIAALMVVTLVLLGGALPSSLQRLVAGITEESESDAQRLEMIDVALRAWSQRPVRGQGIGSFDFLYSGMLDGVYYPHNIVLEILAELGLIGGVLFSLALGPGLGALGLPRRWRGDPWRLTLAMMLVQTAGNAMVSGDLSGNRTLFAVMGLLTGLAAEPGPAAAAEAT